MTTEVIAINDATNTSRNVVTDLIGATDHVQVVKAGFGADGVLTRVDSSNPLPVDNGARGTTDAAAGTTGLLVHAVRRDADTTLVGTDGDLSPLLMDEVGRLKVANYPGGQPAATGAITASGQTVVADVTRASNIMVYVTGTFAGHNCTFEGSIDGTNWFGVQAVRSNANTIELTTGVLGAAPAYAWEISVNGLTNFRVRATAHTSGTANWRIQPAPFATEPIPAAQVSATQPVSGTVTATGVAGAAAHDAAISGNPVRLAGRALTANYAAVATGDVADLVTTLVGALVVKPFSIPDLDWQFAATVITTTTDVVIRAATAGVRHYVTSFQFVNTNATATEVVIKDGASTVIWRGWAGASMVTMVDIEMSTPLRGSVNTALNVQAITTGCNLYFSAQGYSAAA